MTLRWQEVGERAHALDLDHKPEAFERFRSLCGRWCEVWPDDVQPREHRWLHYGRMGLLDLPYRQPPCKLCDRIWAEMDALGSRRKVCVA